MTWGQWLRLKLNELNATELIFYFLIALVVIGSIIAKIF